MALQMAAIVALLASAAWWRRLGPARARIGGALAALLLLASWLSCGSSYVFQKWLGQMLMPPALVWLALLALSVWLWRREQRGPARAACALFVIWGLAGNSWLGGWLVGVLERDYLAQPAPPAPPYQAVAVLGGATNQRPWGEPQLSLGGDRLATAARLYHRGWMDRVLCFGTLTGDQNYAEDAARLVEEMGVPRAAIVPVAGALNTSEEIAKLAELVRERGYQRVGLITSAMHLRRALKLAERHGLAVDPIACDFRASMPPAELHFLPPTAAGVLRVKLALWELLGAALGR